MSHRCTACRRRLAVHAEGGVPRADGVVMNASGVVMIEAVIAFVPLFLLFLAGVQLSLLGAARLIVQHAAVAAVRSAAVVLDDDPGRYAGTARYVLVAKGDADRAGEVPVDSPRLTTIRRAARGALAALAPDAAVVRRLVGPARSSVTGALGEGAALDHNAAVRAMGDAGAPAPFMTAIVFPTEPGADEIALDAVEPAARITVRLTQLVPCAVPGAGALICRRLRWDARAGGLRSDDPDPALQRALRELTRAQDAADQRALAGVPLAVMQAEASLPFSIAPYAYASEREQESARSGS